ncbi:MAG: phage tail sheath subtilisin-like domain-containing protein [Pseudomonadota bacterium]
MAIQASYPGVFIDEVPSAGAISGVGTSTAAFIGPSKSGDLNIPVKITSWENFKRKYGKEPLEGFYLWYAVRSFFQNGGSVCYVTRVSNGSFTNFNLFDQATSPGKKTIFVRARLPGARDIQVKTENSSAVNTVLCNPSAQATVNAAAPKTVVINDSNATANDAALLAAQFRIGDKIKIGSETGIIESIIGSTIRLEASLTGTYTSPTLFKLADLTATTDVIRVQEGAKLSAGSVINIVTMKAIVKQIEVERISGTLKTYKVYLEAPLGLQLTTPIAITSTMSVISQEFNLTVSGANGSGGPYLNLSMDPKHPNYFVQVINNSLNGSIYAYPPDQPNTSDAFKNRPQAITHPRTIGTEEINSNLTPHDYIQALENLEAIDDINVVAIPDCTAFEAQLALKDHCEKLKDRIAILDSGRGKQIFGPDSIVTQLEDVKSKSGYAALYYPWIYVSDFSGKGQQLIPPSGAIAGVYARTDATRGVHKAPAGTDANIRGAFGVDVLTSDADQSQLNPLGINLIRVFAGNNQPLIWGARTTAKDGTDWHYISTRRLFLFIEESIQESIRWAVFEPNNLSLWKKLKRVITDFLRQQWRNGALFGETEEQAFYVRIDEDINPEAERQLGRLNIEIGIKPSYPAEFIIVRIGVWQGGTQVLEN